MSEEEIRDLILRNLALDVDVDGQTIYIRLAYNGEPFDTVKFDVPRPESEL
jgi:hypothetical protein